MELTDSQKKIYDVLNRTNLTDRDKAILISQIQEKLVSGENISTINGQDITKGGNIEIKTSSDVVFKGNYNPETNPAATIQDVKDEISNDENIITKDDIVNNLESDNIEVPLSAAQGKILNEKIENKSSGVYYTNMLLSIDFTSSNLTDDDINQYIGSWDGLVAAIQSNTPIFDKIKLEGQSGSQYTIIPVVAGMSSDNAVDLAMFVGVDETYRQIKIVKTADNKYTLSSAKKVILDNDNNADLLTDDKTVTGAINENFNSIKTTNKSIGQPVIEDIDLSVYDEENLYWTVGGIKSSQQYYRIKYVSLNKGDLIIIQTNAGANANVICVVDALHTKRVLDTGITGAGTLSYFSYLADKDCTVALSYTQANTVSYIVKSTQNTAIADIATSTAALHKIYESYGAVYNESTGYWEMYGLIDLTEEDMYNIYIENTSLIFGSSMKASANTAIMWPFSKARIRFIRTDGSYLAFDGFVFSRFSLIEIFRVREIIYNQDGSLCIIGRGTGLFYSSTRLRDAGNINVEAVTSFIEGKIKGFHRCTALNRCLLKRLKVNVSFEDSPLISYESLNYLVTNAANTSAITVTVHPTTYSYLIGTAQPTAEVGGTTDEWQALVTAAQTKQISFAVPE